MVGVSIKVNSLTREFPRTREPFKRETKNHGLRILSENWAAVGGDAVQILGDSGSGKSTLLAMVGGYLKPSSGSITLAVDGAAFTPKQALKRGYISCCFQQPMLEPQLTAEENCRLFGLDMENIHTYFRSLGVDELRSRKAVDLSGGQQRRVSLVRALGAQRPLCVVDEPLAGLDLSSARLVVDALENYRRDGNLLVHVSHQPLNLLRTKHKVHVKNERI